MKEDISLRCQKWGTSAPFTVSPEFCAWQTAPPPSLSTLLVVWPCFLTRLVKVPQPEHDNRSVRDRPRPQRNHRHVLQNRSPFSKRTNAKVISLCSSPPVNRAAQRNLKSFQSFHNERKTKQQRDNKEYTKREQSKDMESSVLSCSGISNLQALTWINKSVKTLGSLVHFMSWSLLQYNN